MRQGQTFKRCTGCGAKVPERRCPKCDGTRMAWAFVVDVAPPGGTRKQVKRSRFPTKAEALEALHELQADVADGTLVEERKTTVRHYMEVWLDGQRGRLKAGAMDAYRCHWVTYLEPRIGDVRSRRSTGRP